MKLSVLICTYNPRRDILGRVLSALERTGLTHDWEVVLIDNASSPPLSLKEFQPSSLPLRIVREPRLGTVNARLTAIHAAQGSIIVFVDDDNLLAPDYLTEALAFMDAHPAVGAAGGVIKPDFESPPLEWTRSHLNLLALRDLGPSISFSNWGDGETREFPFNSPYGAGMVIRKACADRYVQAISLANKFNAGREGLRTLGGTEDAEIILYGVLKSGLQTAYSPNLRLTHVIPPRRLTVAYLHQLAYESGIAWGEFCVWHGFQRPIPRWTLPLRLVRLYWRMRAWTPSGYLGWKTEAGRFVGRAWATPLSPAENA